MKTSFGGLSIPRKYSDKLVALRRYRVIGFIVLLALLYGFLLTRINTLSNLEPTEEAIVEQVKAAKVPRIDDEIVQQLESLEDNSVSVQALFNEARSNPFQ